MCRWCRAQAGVAQQLLVGIHVGIAGSEQFLPVEDRIGPGHEAQYLCLAGQGRATG